MKKGFSLVEILVVITAFSILAILTTQALSLSLRGTRKSGSVTLVREELNYATAVMERLLHNALPGSVTCPIPPDPYAGLKVSYTDSNNTPTDFRCEDVGAAGYIASGSARLTSTNIEMLSPCSFTCNSVGVGPTTSVDIKLNAQTKAVSAFETDSVQVETKVYLQTY